MNDDVLQSHRIEPLIPEFDPALDSLYKLLIATGKQFGWPVPERAEWEARYKAEIAASRKSHE